MDEQQIQDTGNNSVNTVENQQVIDTTTQVQQESPEQRIARLESERTNATRKAEYWQAQANHFYNQAIANGATEKQAEQYAQQQASGSSDYATIADLQKITAETTEKVIDRKFANIHQQYQENALHMQAAEIVKHNWQPAKANTDPEQFARVVYEQALINKHLNQNTLGYTWDDAYLAAASLLGNPKIQSGTAAPQVTANPGNSGYGSQVSIQPTGLEGQLAQAQKEMDNAKQSYANHPTSENRLKADAAIDAYYSFVKKKESNAKQIQRI
jgi:hypothetical protein